MIKLFLILMAVVFISRYDMNDVTAYLKREGSQFLSDVSYSNFIDKHQDTEGTENQPGRYRLKAFSRS
jgi:hypothetical protein